MGFTLAEGWTSKITTDKPIYIMTSSPQAVTERYVSNLIHYGRNKEFDITDVRRLWSKVDGVNVGIYFEVYIVTNSLEKQEQGLGATIAQAVRRALEKHGVTFR